jgi:predicted DNA-binding ribbon-helix-helix protein
MNQNIHTVRWPSGHWACIHLESEFWDLFRLATIERGTTIGRLLAEVDRTHRLLPYQGPGTPRVLGLSAAVRVFVLREVMTKLARAEARASRRRPAAHRSYPTAHQELLEQPGDLFDVLAGQMLAHDTTLTRFGRVKHTLPPCPTKQPIPLRADPAAVAPGQQRR